MANTRSKFEFHARAADDPAMSIRAMQAALVHLCVRTPKPLPDASVLDLSEALTADAYRFAMVRRLSEWLGQPQRCTNRACRRAKTCQGRPPNCWRNEPPPIAAEVALAQAILERQVHEIVGNVADQRAR